MAPEFKLLAGGRLHDVESMYRDLFRYYYLSHDAKVTRDLCFQLMKERGQVEDVTLARLLQESDADLESAAFLAELTRQVRQKLKEDFGARLAENLASIAGICHRFQVPVILLTYPRDTKANAYVREFASVSGLPLVDSEPHLKALRQAGRLPENYFLAWDGHPNDRGYAEMARLVAAHILGQQDLSTE